MISSRAQAWVGLAIGGVALVIGLIASRGDDKDADALRRYSEEQAALHRERRDRAVAVPIDLPAPARDVDLDRPSLVVTIDEAGATFVGGEAVARDELHAVFTRAYARDRDTQVVIQADAATGYDAVVRVMDLAKEAGLTRLAIGTEPAGP